MNNTPINEDITIQEKEQNSDLLNEIYNLTKPKNKGERQRMRLTLKVGMMFRLIFIAMTILSIGSAYKCFIVEDYIGMVAHFIGTITFIICAVIAFYIATVEEKDFRVNGWTQ